MQNILTLNDGRSMPQMGLGLMRFGAEEETPAVFGRAVDAGYRLFDTAAVYGTEPQTGAGLRAVDCPREELFITTKLWNEEHSKGETIQACNASLARLQLDYLDLYLIHWPLPMFDRYIEAWQALIELQKSGKVRSIGVSNFTEEHLDRIIGETGVAPAVNQVEMHPYFQQESLRAYHDRHGIVTQAWSPIGGGWNGASDMRSDPVFEQIAKKHGRTPTQVILRWHIACGASMIPKATSSAHLVENMHSFGFDLDAEDLALIRSLDRPDGRMGFDPLTMDIVKLDL
jgi:2,5-diketo-D-gluconate reductase A